MDIKFLRAFNGDCIHLSFRDGKRKISILIDGGMPNTYRNSKNKKGKQEDGDLKALLEDLRKKGEKIDLLILTHVDDDHIGGILNWFKQDQNASEMLGEVWFNSGRLIKESMDKSLEDNYDNSIDVSVTEGTNTSIGQGVKFEDFLESKDGLWKRELIQATEKLSYKSLAFVILSPNEERLKSLLKKWEKEKPESLETAAAATDYKMSIKEHIEADVSAVEDKAVHNGSSIAFILTFSGKKMLFLGDAHPSVVAESLRQLNFSKESPLTVEFVKLSHHGSMFNNSSELLELIDSKKFIVSTNGDRHLHPHKRLLARVVKMNDDCEFYFNYPVMIDKIFSEEDKKDYPNIKFFGTDKLTLKDSE
jgi:beta-lactamase superfamily II metal-dependent hydrolase